MHYGFSHDEVELVTHLGRQLGAPRAEDTDWEAEQGLWKLLADQDWLAAIVGAEDLSRSAIVAMGEQFGRACPPVPWTSTLGFTGPLLANLDTDEARHLAAQVSRGTLIAAAPGRSIAFDGSAATGATVHLNGSLSLVPYGAQASGLVLLVDTSAGSMVVHLDADAAGLTTQDVPTLDLRHRFADVTLREVPGIVVADAGAGVDAAVRIAEAKYSLMLSAEALGGLAHLVDEAVRYVGERRQFGQPIGSFQAVKHLIAHSATVLENGKALTYLAASQDPSAPGALEDIDSARAYTRRCYVEGAEQVIQVHGGYGFTWEAGLHVWYRNAMVNAALS